MKRRNPLELEKTNLVLMSKFNKIYSTLHNPFIIGLFLGLKVRLRCCCFSSKKIFRGEKMAGSNIVGRATLRRAKELGV